MTQLLWEPSKQRGAGRIACESLHHWATELALYRQGCSANHIDVWGSSWLVGRGGCEALLLEGVQVFTTLLPSSLLRVRQEIGRVLHVMLIQRDLGSGDCSTHTFVKRVASFSSSELIMSLWNRQESRKYPGIPENPEF